MAIATINPLNGEHVKSIDGNTASEINAALAGAAGSAPAWAGTTFARRVALMRNTAAVLRSQSDRWARLITLEMGKIIREARAEVEKCAGACEFYAEHAQRFLADEKIESDAGFSYVASIYYTQVLGSGQQYRSRRKKSWTQRMRFDSLIRVAACDAEYEATWRTGRE